MASLGFPTEDNKRNFARGSLTELFFVFNQFHQMNRTTTIFQGINPRRFFSLPRSLHNQGQLLILQQKNKALPEGGQRLNSKNDTNQDRVYFVAGLDNVRDRTPKPGDRTFKLG